MNLHALAGQGWPPVNTSSPEVRRSEDLKVFLIDRNTCSAAGLDPSRRCERRRRGRGRTRRLQHVGHKRDGRRKCSSLLVAVPSDSALADWHTAKSLSSSVLLTVHYSTSVSPCVSLTTSRIPSSLRIFARAGSQLLALPKPPEMLVLQCPGRARPQSRIAWYVMRLSYADHTFSS